MKVDRSTTASPAPLVRVAPSDRPLVTFVTVTFGTGPIVVDMIRSLVTTTPNDIEFEVIVVDNPHPAAGTRTMRHLRLDTAGVQVVRPDGNTGFGGGCEWGAWFARGRALAFVNPDLEFRPGWLRPALAALDEPNVSIVAPVLLEADGTVQEAGGSVTPEGWTTSHREVAATTIADVQYASAACWLIRTDEHERLGGFDPAFHPAYFEDVDLALRARRLGGRCVVPTDSRVVHHRGGSTPDAPTSERQHDVFVDRWPLVAWRA